VAPHGQARSDIRALRAAPDETLAKAIAASCERFATPGTANLDALLQRIGDARIVLLGEATHGTSEFYRMRERISRELIERKGFCFIAIEGDWPDAARIDHYVRHARHAASEWTAFARFPVWMWRNQEVRSFVDWLRAHNARDEVEHKVAFYGLDLYSLYNSIRSVLRYLEDVDPLTATVARQRYGCLTPWQSDPATYGRAALTSAYQTCEREVVSTLTDLLKKHRVYAEHDGARFLDAVQNARLVANAEAYYRTMYYGSRSSWNLRDSHMFETLKNLLEFHGPHSKAIVWAHNSHVGDSAATDMVLRGEYNIGHLCRKHFGRGACLIGFGTHSGSVAAAPDWDAPMQVMAVRPSLAGSHERLCHEADVARFVLPLRGALPPSLAQGLSKPRLERAIGVIYRPETELQSHYFDAVLPRQFDEYIWFDETKAVTPLKTEEIEGMPETYPFGL
jgi:protein-L-isoaspartate(D-aspartate) O-methyltransferase